MDTPCDIDVIHIEKAVEKIEMARKVGINERLAVQKYCDDHELSCMADVYCMAIGIVERKKIVRYYKVENELLSYPLSGNI